MIEGRLRWSQLHFERGWYVWSHGEEFCYYAKPVTDGWETSVGNRRHNIDHISLGRTRLLTDAKRLADQHHHEHIRQVGPEPLYQYTLRYPVEEDQ
jgi:hypothetical protein